MTDHPIRPERSVEHYSRGGELVRAIRALWTANKGLAPGSEGLKAKRIEALMTEFDLTFPEWHYWLHQVQLAEPAVVTRVYPRSHADRLVLCLELRGITASVAPAEGGCFEVTVSPADLERAKTVDATDRVAWRCLHTILWELPRKGLGGFLS